MTLAPIEPGTFVMGTTEAQFSLLKQLFPTAKHEAFIREGPAHQVRITRPFSMATHPVTVGQFRRFVAQTGYKTDGERDGKGGHMWDESARDWVQGARWTWLAPGFPQGDDHPVVLVSWNDAHAFIKWLNSYENDSLRYRLPTEAEWEYACRAGTTTLFPNGDDHERLPAIANIADASVKKRYPKWDTIRGDDGHTFTSPVGTFKANARGLHDMIGNVWEWCEDGFDASYYRKSPVDDPPGPAVAPTRVLRGGSWASTSRGSRSAIRNTYPPDYRSSSVGFRVAAVRVRRTTAKAER